MTGPTHKQYSICFAYLTMMLFFNMHITQINYYFALIIVLMTSKSGALFPDLDHTWDNVKNKTVINRIINVLIHITGGKHRSWQTHSIDICAYFTIAGFIIPELLFSNSIFSVTNKEVLKILWLGFASGWISHMFSDMLNGTGVRLLCFLKLKVSFVPKKLGKLKFNTGEEWENFNFKLVKKINFILGIICILYPLFMYGYIDINKMIKYFN